MSATEIVPSQSVAKLIEEYSGLDVRDGDLVGGGRKGVAFIEVRREEGVKPPASLARIECGDSVAFVVPGDFEHDDVTTYLTSDWSTQWATAGKAFVPKSEDWPSDAEIKTALDKYAKECEPVARERKIRERLSAYREPGRSPLATVQSVAEEAPQLVSDFMPDNAVSVVYGKLDEFKTTLIYDLGGSIATGAAFQGFTIPRPRPVIIYALEGAEAATPRLRAVEAKLQRQNTAWGDFPMAVAVRDRIPETDVVWRKELQDLSREFATIHYARAETSDKSLGRYPEPNVWDLGTTPVVIIDTLSMALGGDAETGPAAVEFVSRCLDLMKRRPDLQNPSHYSGRLDPGSEFATKYPQLGAEDFLDDPVASAVIIVHHPTKGGDDFGGHRAIGANTQALYRVHRFGSMADPQRPMKGIITPLRTKDMARPSPLRFEAEVVPVPGAEGRTTVVLKDAAPEVPEKLKPIAKALTEIEADGQGVLAAGDVLACVDKIAKNRATRSRYRTQLVDAGVLEPALDEADKLIGYRLHGNA